MPPGRLGSNQASNEPVVLSEPERKYALERAQLTIAGYGKSDAVHVPNRGAPRTGAFSGQIASQRGKMKPDRLPPGWHSVEVIEARPNNGVPSGFRAEIFRKRMPDGSYRFIMSFAGTDDWHDLGVDALNARGILTDQYKYAMDRAKAFVRRYGDGKQTTNLEFVGHSMGGGLATAASAVTGVRATTFNSAGVSDDVVASEKTLANRPATIRNIRPGQVTAFRIQGELVTTNQDFFPGLIDTVGRQVTLRTPLSGRDVTYTAIGTGAFGPAGGWVAYGSSKHLMDNFIKVLDR